MPRSSGPTAPAFDDLTEALSSKIRTPITELAIGQEKQGLRETDAETHGTYRSRRFTGGVQHSEP